MMIFLYIKTINHFFNLNQTFNLTNNKDRKQ